MPKYRVSYSASKSKHTYRERNGQRELMDSQIIFNRTASPTVEAKNEKDAIESVRRTLPSDCNFTVTVHKL